MKKKYWIAILGGIAVVLAVVLIVVAVISRKEDNKDDRMPGNSQEQTSGTDKEKNPSPDEKIVDGDTNDTENMTDNENKKEMSDASDNGNIKNQPGTTEGVTEFLPENGADSKETLKPTEPIPSAPQPSEPQPGENETEEEEPQLPGDSEPIELPFVPYKGR